MSADDIAERLGRHPSTIYRELGRCGGVEGVYDAEAAQAEARLRALRPKAAKLEAGPALAGEVNDRLGLCWSPHAISADLAAVGASVCAEAIYRAVCSGRCLGDDAWKCLPRQQRCRRRRSRRGDKASPLGERPAAAADRSEPGRWEGDLIIGANNKTAAAALVVALPDGYRAPRVAEAVTAAPARQPAHLVRSLTWDQGRELARWADIETELGIDVCFCEPHSPWQRGTNEQTNALLRRRPPKGTPLDLNPLRLSIIEDSLNTMPRRLHN
ncbi:IS30 family transposase [Candidatus Poriferisodalis sp.]|uniref:IS30 family transposase n=1 Tax=Candidatus Poriferisodalis sp. TaxID=3101277 RepID=UPI003B0273DC